MSIFKIFCSKKFQKNVAIYISEKNSEIIIAPLYQEGINGIIFEQENCIIIPFNSSFEEIGEKVKTQFHLFKIIKNRTLKKYWSAFEASKEKTKVSFEKNYTRISVSGANEYNIIFNLETNFINLSKLEIHSSISAFCDNYELGKLIMKIYNSEIITN
ncbi:hypothetical protein [Flavobacterium terrigena]|uniref:Uncharacterized protein n=1 Tax=Flavobacterium terrigena TaxID=402734 RepID=A0A1H6RVZ3_9FLAO|nr:hypothetical protein [Flavobacterium terrigena]SEI59901.1 hypothetical protein SAMN05660918_1084 [Flavobacterium terrigena]